MKWFRALIVVALCAAPVGASAWWKSIQQVGVVASGAATTWNPFDKDTGTSLSNFNLTATGTADSRSGVRATVSSSSAKKYHEITIATNNGITPTVGFGDASEALNNISIGDDTHGIGIAVGGQVSINGSSLGGGDTWGTNGDVLGIAIDLTANLIWYRVNGGNWNSSAPANPATGTGGFNTSTRAAGAYFPMVMSGRFGAGGTFDVFTANFGATSYANAAPSGFGNW